MDTSSDSNEPFPAGFFLPDGFACTFESKVSNGTHEQPLLHRSFSAQVGRMTRLAWWGVNRVETSRPPSPPKGNCRWDHLACVTVLSCVVFFLRSYFAASMINWHVTFSLPYIRLRNNVPLAAKLLMISTSRKKGLPNEEILEPSQSIVTSGCSLMNEPGFVFTFLQRPETSVPDVHLDYF